MSQRRGRSRIWVSFRPVRRVPKFLLLLLCCALALQPVQCLRLPGNLQAPDLAGLAWIALALPWLRERARSLPLPMFGPFALVLAASSVAAAQSSRPGDSATALAVELWLYAWFAALACTLAAAKDKERNLLLGTWVAAGVGNGLWILVQFTRPDLQSAASDALGSLGALDPFRPSGFFENCNSAAFFQLSALAPLAVLRVRRAVTLPCAAVLVLSVLGTGSMGALMALLAATATALLAVLVVQRDAAAFARASFALAAGALAVAALAATAAVVDEGFAHRVDYVLTGRGEGSAHSRMTLWTQGVELLQEQFLPFGIGPDQFQHVAGFGMHNDALSFAVERGMLGFAALFVFAAAAANSAWTVARRGARDRDRSAVAPLAALAACCALSMTHEIFHQRPLWLLLALQEGMRLRHRAKAGIEERVATPRHDARAAAQSA